MKRLSPTDRKNMILETALILAETKGYDKITRDELAAAANVSGPTVNYHFGTIENFREVLLDYAIARCNLTIAFQALCRGVDIPKSLRRAVVDSLL